MGETAHMQRVRIGLTGLAFVFLLVLLAAIFTRPSAEEPITANSIEQQRLPGNAAAVREDAEPKEPLAELGVAPGNADSNQSNSKAPPPPR
jgi:hypothetical protein